MPLCWTALPIGILFREVLPGTLISAIVQLKHFLCVQTSVWTTTGGVDEETTCDLAQTSISDLGDGHQDLACCFAEGQHCNDNSQCCAGHQCVYANDAYGIQLTDRPVQKVLNRHAE